MKSLLPTVLLVPAVLIVAATSSGCAPEESSALEHEASTRLVTRPLRRDVNVTHDYVAQIHSSRHIELKALARGYLERVLVNEGQRVAKGQLMFKLLPVTYQAELQRSKAEAEAARLEYENTRRLNQNNVVSDTELSLAQAHYQRALAEVELAQAHLGFTEIRAPMDGIMDRLHVREGSLVDEGEFLTTLSDNSVMWVYFNVPEAEYLDYASAPQSEDLRTVKLLMANGRTFAHDGQVTVIEADFNNQTGTIPFRADFPNPDGLLRHGQTGNVLLSSPLPGAVLIPQKATFEILDHTYVFVVDDDGHVHQRRIRIAQELEDVFVVSEGLTEKDMIVLEGLRQTRDGEEIEYEYEEPADVLASLKVPAE